MQSIPLIPTSWRSILPNLISIFPLPILHQNFGSGPRLTLSLFRNKIRFYGEEFFSTSPNPQAAGQHIARCPRLLIQYIHSYPPYCRPFLHRQHENAPCRGDMHPLVAALGHIKIISCVSQFQDNVCHDVWCHMCSYDCFVERDVWRMEQLREVMITSQYLTRHLLHTFTGLRKLI
jgi:hypothetical protein